MFRESFEVGWLAGLVIILGLLLGYAFDNNWISVVISIHVVIVVVTHVATKRNKNE